MYIEFLKCIMRLLQQYLFAKQKMQLSNNSH